MPDEDQPRPQRASTSTQQKDHIYAPTSIGKPRNNVGSTGPRAAYKKRGAKKARHVRKPLPHSAEAAPDEDIMSEDELVPEGEPIPSGLIMRNM